MIIRTVTILKMICGIGFSSLLVSLTACQHQSKVSIEANGQWGKMLPGGDPEAKIIVIPQWHLSPGTITKNGNAKPLPQKENQMAIYKQVGLWARSKTVRSLIAEGCEGEIQKGFAPQFNGWSLQDLMGMALKSREPVMTHVGLKLEADFLDKLQVLCGDNLALIQKQQLAFSNLRGLLGFKTRIDQHHSSPKKRRSYLAGLKKVLKLPMGLDDESTVKALNLSLRDRFSEFESLLAERNSHFVSALENAKKPAVVVIGALHVENLVKKLRDQKNTVKVFQPNGLRGDEKVFLQTMKRQIFKMTAE